MVDAVTRIIALFGEDRCFFASNYPVDFGLPDVFVSPVLVPPAAIAAIRRHPPRQLGAAAQSPGLRALRPLWFVFGG